MKIAVSDLKKAIQWIEANTREVQVLVELAHDGRNLCFKCEDKFSTSVEITLFSDASMLAKIKKEDVL
jgi:hypothetical protein